MANKNVNLSFTLTPYKLNDCDFKLSDGRATKSLNNFGLLNYTLTASEVSNIVDMVTKFSVLKFSETFALSEQHDKYIIVNQKELVSIVATYWDNIKFVLRFVETFACSDRLSKSYHLNKAANIGVSDYSSREVGINLLENIAITDDVIRNLKFVRLFLEVFKIIDKEANSIVLNSSECFKIVEQLFKNMVLLKRENLLTTDKVKYRSKFKRLFQESIANMGSITKEIFVNKREAVFMEDVLIRACNAVLSNIAISVDGMSLGQFKDMVLTPPGYDKFVDFNVGDYEYQKALVRLIVESVAAQAEPLIYDMGIHVDIDDTNDRGTTEVTDISRATKVYFNKFYYHPPEVNVSLKGGNAADGLIIPSIISIGNVDENGRFFEVELLNGENKRVTGFITWTSKGY